MNVNQKMIHVVEIKKTVKACTSHGDLGREYQSSASYAFYVDKRLIGIAENESRGTYREPASWVLTRRSVTGAERYAAVYPHTPSFKALKAWARANPEELLQRADSLDLKWRKDLDEKGDAVAEYRKAIELDPNDAGVHFKLALALKEKGRHDVRYLAGASSAMAKAIALDPNLK